MRKIIIKYFVDYILGTIIFYYKFYFYFIVLFVFKEYRNSFCSVRGEFSKFSNFSC